MPPQQPTNKLLPPPTSQQQCAERQKWTLLVCFSQLDGDDNDDEDDKTGSMNMLLKLYIFSLALILPHSSINALKFPNLIDVFDLVVGVTLQIFLHN